MSRQAFRRRLAYVIGGSVIGAAVTYLLFGLSATRPHFYGADQQVADPVGILDPGWSRADPHASSAESFRSQYQQLQRDLNESLYYFDRPGQLLPLMRRLQEAEGRREFRVSAGRAWLRTQAVVVAATVRDGMTGLPSSVRNLGRLRRLFNASWLVFVENESRDATRGFLYNWTRTDPTVTLLGCDTVNSLTPCHLGIRYSSGKQHEPGSWMKRTFAEEVERGLVMSALRNQYLSYVYDKLAHNATLLLVIDPDVSWTDWDLDSIAQGAYYFMDRPGLQQLCAHTTMSSEIYDPCTLAFHLNKHYGEDTNYPMVDYNKSLRSASPDLPPVKVESCFQAFAFYRLAHLVRRRLRYRRSPGEWMCEHNTLSRQLGEVYIDPQMRLQVAAANVG